MNTPSDPYDRFAELERLAQIAEIISSIQESERQFALSEQEFALTSAQWLATSWENALQTQRARCADAAACSDLRCRRKRICRRLSGLDVKVKQARHHLGAERAKWPAPPRIAAEPGSPRSGNKKGRTVARP